MQIGAALDAAITLGKPIVGWCPKDGWAEDMETAPGLLAKYPQLKETPLEDASQRTEWNVRDSDATVLVCDEHDSCSLGTDKTAAFAVEYDKPFIYSANHEPKDIYDWLKGIGNNLDVNFAGSRESEKAGTYEKTSRFVIELLDMDDRRSSGL